MAGLESNLYLSGSVNVIVVVIVTVTENCHGELSR